MFVPSNPKGVSHRPPLARCSRYVRMALVCLACSSGAVKAQPADLPQSAKVIQGLVTYSLAEEDTLTLHQASQTAVVEWQSFNIGEGHAVNVRQPFFDSVLLNRVVGDGISVIAGTLRAPGSVVLVNPNGIHITPSGRVFAGGFLASSLDVDNDDLNLTADALHKKANARMHSTRVARHGSVSGRGGVLNEGLIQIADAGYVSLAGARMVQSGVIMSRGGHVALSGPAYLRVEGKIDLDRPPAPRAAGTSVNGDVAGASHAASATATSLPRAINNATNNAANSATAGTAFIATPGTAFIATPSAIPSASPGSLLPPGSLKLLGSSIDIHVGRLPDGVPPDFRSFVHAEALAGALHDASVTVSSVGTWPAQPSDNGASSGALKLSMPAMTDPLELANALEKAGWRAGDIHITSPIAWSADTSLILASTGAIRFDAPVTATGNDSLVSLYPGVRHDVAFTAGQLSLHGEAARLAVSGQPYCLIRNAKELQKAIRHGSAQDYAIAQNLDLHGVPMSPITLPASPRAYRINGLGNSVKGLAIDSKATAGVGLFSALRGQSTVSHLHLIDPDIRGIGETGAFVGVMHDQSRLIGVSVKGGNISATAAGSAYGSLGGMVGAMQDQSVISHAQLRDVTVRGVDNVGGIAGGMSARAHIKDTVFSGTTHGRDRVGGIVGQQRGGRVERITLRGDVNGRHDVGGVSGSVGTGSLITAALSDGAVLGASRPGAIAGCLPYGSRYRMVGNVTPKGAQHYGEDFGTYVGAYVSPPDAVSAPSQTVPSYSPDPIMDQIRKLNPRPWKG